MIIINNAAIKLGSDLIKGSITIGEDDERVMFCGSNISGGVIDSYYSPHLVQCFLQNVTKVKSSSVKGGGPTFISCHLDNIEIPENSILEDCATP